MPALCPGLVAFPIIMAGGIPVFVDVDADTQLITAATVQPAITAKTAAIIAVALHGLPCNIAELKRFNLPIVEDCAQALFARYKDGWSGTFGTIGCYSFERSKPAELPPADEKRLRANKAAWAYFQSQPPWYRRTATHWVVSAKREETRARRLATLIADSAAGRTIRPLTRPKAGA